VSCEYAINQEKSKGYVRSSFFETTLFGVYTFWARKETSEQNYTHVLRLDDKEVAKYGLKCNPDDIHELPFGLETKSSNFRIVETHVIFPSKFIQGDRIDVPVKISIRRFRYTKETKITG